MSDLVLDKLSNSPKWVRRHSCCLDLVLNNRWKGIFPLCGAAVEDHQGIKWKGERMHLRFRKFPKVWTSHNSGGEGQLGGMEINKTSLRSSPQFWLRDKLITLTLLLVDIQYFSNLVNCIFPEWQSVFLTVWLLWFYGSSSQFGLDSKLINLDGSISGAFFNPES